MKTYQKILAYTLGSAALVGGGLALFMTKTGRGFRAFLDAMYDREFPDVTMVMPDSLATELAGKRPPLLLDTRTPEEYAVSHLRNAQFINAPSFSLDDVDDIDRDREIVVYCSIGHRSSEIARRMAGYGFTNVRNLYGGIFLWYNQDRPVYDGTRRVDRLHPYNWLWGQFVTRAGKTSDTLAGPEEEE